MEGSKKEKENTPVQGAGVSNEKASENQDQQTTENLVKTDEQDDAVKTEEVPAEEAPAWATDLIDSNKSVAESNNRLAEALENFQGFSAPGTEQKKAVKKAAPEFNPNATYVVAKGQKFNDVENYKVCYKAGDDVTSLGEKRIKAMLENGLVVEK